MPIQVLKVNQIELDNSIYPRINWSWQTSYDYAMSMKAGAEFPPITVAKVENKFLLVDGKHRLEALKMNKEQYVSADVLEGLSTNDIYIEAVKRNINHGRHFSPQDKANIIVKLKDMRLDIGDISQLIRIPLDKIERFTMDRMTNTVSGQTVILKAPSMNLKGVIVEDNFMEIQKPFSANGQGNILDQFITLLENNILNLNNQTIRIRLVKIKDLLDGIVGMNKAGTKNEIKVEKKKELKTA